MSLKVGDVVRLNKSLAVVVGTAGDRVYDDVVPEGHVALWYGGIDRSEENEVWTVPSAYCIRVDSGRICH